MSSLVRNSFYSGPQLFTVNLKTQSFLFDMKILGCLKIESLYIPGIIYPVGAKVIIWRVCRSAKGKSTLTIAISAGV
jgi:hypothetical protein